MDTVRKFSPALFAIIIFCFLLPFYNISCSDQKVISLTGFQVVTGTEYKQHDTFGDESKTKDIKPEPFAILALLAAIAGLAVSFIKMRIKSLPVMILSILGVVFLFLLKNKLDTDVISEGQSIITINYEFGYWFAFILFAVSAVIQGIIYSQDKKGSGVQGEVGSSEDT